MDSFQDKTAIITGAGSGIGFEIARAFAGRGGNVVINDIDESLLRRAQESIDPQGSRCRGVHGDAGELECIGTLIRTAVTEFGKIDVTVCNAGITTFDPFLEFKYENFQELVDLNLRGTFFLAQKAAQQMVDQGTGGRIVLISSVTGLTHHPGLSTYGMTKAAIIFLAKTLGVELAEHGITVNAISPGATLTERTMEQEEGRFQEIWERTNPTGRCITVEEIAHAVLFLSSEESGQITGQNIVVDGGWSSAGPPPG